MSLRVLVTGSSGFIGRHLVAELIKKGYEVMQADIRSERQENKYDLREREQALAAFKNAAVCIALAARSGGIRLFNEHPAEMLDDNLRILSATFEAARASGVARIVYVSSSCVFDRSTAYPITEQAIKKSPSPPPGYPFSKFVGEMYCQSYQQQYGLPYVIVRPFNVYGVGELPGRKAGESHVIPDLTYKVLMGQNPLEIFGDGSQTRCFTHVSDIVKGIILAMESDQAQNEDFNLGHPREISVKELAETLWRMSGKTEPLSFRYAPAFPHDVKRRAVDISKARTLLKWEPSVDLHEGLEDYISWLRKIVRATHQPK